MTTVAGVAGYVVARTSGWTKAKAPTTGANGYGPSTTPGRYLVPYSEVPANGGLILAADEIVLVREPGGVLKGFSAVCTHQGCTVAMVQNGIISCPCHGSEFSTLNGHVVQGRPPGPCLRSASSCATTTFIRPPDAGRTDAVVAGSAHVVVDSGRRLCLGSANRAFVTVAGDMR